MRRQKEGVIDSALKRDYFFMIEYFDAIIKQNENLSYLKLTSTNNMNFTGNSNLIHFCYRNDNNNNQDLDLDNFVFNDALLVVNALDSIKNRQRGYVVKYAPPNKVKDKNEQSILGLTPNACGIITFSVYAPCISVWLEKSKSDHIFSNYQLINRSEFITKDRSLIKDNLRLLTIIDSCAFQFKLDRTNNERISPILIEQIQQMLKKYSAFIFLNKDIIITNDQGK